MTEECNSCGKEVTKYVLFEVAEIEDVAGYDSDIRNYYDAIICNNCWIHIQNK